MLRKIVYKILFFFAISFCGLSSYAQDGAYGAFTPYSIFGIGDISKQGTAYNKSMGGVGIALRNNRFINFMNPAAVSARDSLAFMADFGIIQANNIYKQGNITSANNNFNFYDFVITFPIYRSSAMVVGVIPFSNVGYDFAYIYDDPKLTSITGPVKYTSKGNGGVYQLFAGAGVTFWKRLSLGAEGLYYFGGIDKQSLLDFYFSNQKDIKAGFDMNLSGFSGKLGIQYEQPIKDMSLTFGATYRFSSKLRGTINEHKYAYISSLVDTITNNTVNLDKLNPGAKIADELGVGISFRKKNKWAVEMDYLRSGWNNAGFQNIAGFANNSKTIFSTTASESFRAGFEFVPNRNDIRYYFRKCTYRAGAYYDKDFYKIDGNTIRTFGITFGMTFPILRFHNGITFGVDMGQRGFNTGNITREQYLKFHISFNIADIWFQKPRYN